MNEQDLELLITRSIDGDLSVDEQAQLDAELARDPEARRMLEQHRALDEMLRAEPAMESVNWDRLATSISANIDRAEEASRQAYSMKWVRRAGSLALAASVLIAMAVGVRQLMHREAQQFGNRGAVQIAVLMAPGDQGGHTQIDITPSLEFVAIHGDLPVTEAIVSPPTRVAIDSGLLPAQDNGRLPF